MTTTNNSRVGLWRTTIWFGDELLSVAYAETRRSSRSSAAEAAFDFLKYSGRIDLGAGICGDIVAGDNLSLRSRGAKAVTRRVESGDWDAEEGGV